MSTPSVSVIVPVYNVEPYLRQCLDSLINQTLHDIEIICVDDGSTDGSPVILQEYAAKDERIRIVKQKNAGLSAARNAGMKVMTAPYVMFCDSDDWYEPTMCEIMYHAIEGETEVEMAMCARKMEYEYEVSEERILADEKFSVVQYSGLTELSEEILFPDFTPSVCSKIFRCSFLSEHRIQFPEGLKFEDFYFFNICAAHVTHMIFVPERLYHYRRRPGSIMHEVIHKKAFVSIDRLRVATLLWDYYKKHGLLRKWNGYIAKKWIQSLRSSLYHEQAKKARTLVADIVSAFIEENDKCDHALSNSERNEIIKILNSITSSPPIRNLKYKIKKTLINLLPAAAWRRRLRRKYL